MNAVSTTAQSSSFNPLTCATLSLSSSSASDISTLSLHDALPIFQAGNHGRNLLRHFGRANNQKWDNFETIRSEEHTSELQSQSKLVCRLLLEKKNPSAASRAPSCKSG